MGEYIVSPTFVYWMNTLGSIAITCGFFGGIFFFAFSISLIWHFTTLPYADKDDKDFLLSKKWFIIFGIISLIFIVLAIIIPSKNTMLEMLIAKVSTKENVQSAIEAGKSLVDYVVNAIKEVSAVK